MKSLNSNCQSPFIVKDKTNWYIMFRYVDSIGKLRSYKKAFRLNKDTYLKKVNGIVKEINKKQRQVYADQLVENLIEELATKHFNVDTREFEITDKAELPFSKYLTDYINHTPAKKREQSTKDLYIAYNNVILQYLNSKGLSDIKLNEVTREFVSDFLATKDVENGGSTNHRDNYLRYLKGVFKFTVEYLEVLPKNPLNLLRTINNRDSKSNKAFSESMLIDFLENVKQKDYLYSLLLRMIYYTLRRPSELLKVQYKDVDFENGTIDFEADSIKTNNKLYAQLPQHLVDELKGLIPKVVRRGDYLFGNTGIEEQATGKPKYSKKLFAPAPTPLHHFQSIQKTFKLEKGFTMYGMKHTGVKYMIEVSNWTDSEIIAYTGHSNTEILGRYARDAKRPKRQHTGTI